MSDQSTRPFTGVRYKVNSSDWVVDSSDAVRRCVTIKDLYRYLEDADPTNYKLIDRESSDVRMNVNKVNFEAELVAIDTDESGDGQLAYVAFNKQSMKGGQ